jgi:hypothetical protein
MSIFMDILPETGGPRIIHEAEPLMNVLLSLSYVLGGLVLAILVFALLAWVWRYWSLGGRIFYSLLALAQKWLIDLRNGQSSQRAELPTNGDHSTALEAGSGHASVEIRRALLLVGSPKTRKSTSNSLGEYLFEQLGAQSIETETIYLDTVLHSPAKMPVLLDAVDAADLVTLAFPLSVDPLLAPVLEALERIAAHRQRRHPSQRQLFTAIADCGFPEAYHCTTALAICETFARQAGFEWAGALALGGGERVNGAALVEAGRMTIRIRKSLEVAAEALVQGKPSPKQPRIFLESQSFPTGPTG